VKFVRSVELAASIERVFTFHADPHNIGTVSPPGLSVEVLKAESFPRTGDNFVLRVRQLGLPLLWRGRWETVEAPSLLVDSARVFPFSQWRHEHQFVAVGASSRMTDRVHFRISWFLGGTVAEWIAAKVIFPLLFAYRHKKTRELFATG
jgi:ligand-binding SRPBCC domain-containing protein